VARRQAAARPTPITNLERPLMVRPDSRALKCGQVAEGRLIVETNSAFVISLAEHDLRYLR
jgi:hypothetical protein